MWPKRVRGWQSETKANCCGTIVEEGPELSRNEEPVDQPAQHAVRQGIVDTVFHHGVAIPVSKVMLMPPGPVGAADLGIDKELTVAPGFNTGTPLNRQAEYPKAVFDGGAALHQAVSLLDIKGHFRGCEKAEIAGF